MSEKKLTPWFPSTTPPVREGVYQRDLSGIPWYAYWDGKRWFQAAGTIEGAMVNKRYNRKSSLYNLCWRGLLNE